MVVSAERRLSVPCSTFETTSSRGTRLNCWKIMAQRDCHSRRAAPLSVVISVPS